MRRETDEKTKINWLRSNWELVVCISLFLVCCLSIILLHIHSVGNLPAQNIVSIAILKFIAICLMAAFSLAYGIRCRGLIALADYLKRGISEIQDEIDICTRPTPPAINTDHEETLHELVAGILGRLKDKASYHLSPFYSVMKDSSSPLKANDRKTVWIDPPQIHNKSIYEEGPTIIARLTRITEWEALHFPEFYEQLLRISNEYNRKENELKSTIERIEAIENNIQADRASKKDAIKDLINQITHYKENILQLMEKQFIPGIALQQIWMPVILK